MNMKVTRFSLILIVCLLTLLAGCKNNAVLNTTPGTVGKGQIDVIIYEDLNLNEVRDAGEAVFTDPVALLPAKCSETASLEAQTITTNPDGTWVFHDLEPGYYCLNYMGTHALTSKMNLDINLTLGGEAKVQFRIHQN